MTSQMLAAADPALERARAVWDHRIAGPGVKLILAVVAIYASAAIAFNASFANILNGISTGTLFGLMGVGIILIYRTNRIINFAAAGLGAVPGVAAALLLVVELRETAWWYLCFPLAIVGGAMIGALVDVFIIRRFARSPRLILTVATIGLVQILAYFSLLIPIWMGSEGKPISYVPTPFKQIGSFTIGNQRFSWDIPFTILIVAVAVAALALFLRFTRMGIALRASSENPDRAALLGIPVKRVQTVAWAIAGAIGGLTIFQRAAVIGVPTDGSLGFKVLLFALTAAVIAKMEHIPTCLVAGMGIGVLVSASVVYTGADSLASAIMLGVILAVLLVQRGRFSRAYDIDSSSFQTIGEFRSVPIELQGLPEVVWPRLGLGAIVAGAFVAAPFLFPASRVSDLQNIVITAMIVLSLVVLTGWAGQISLGQMAFVGVGAAVAGKLATELEYDFFVTLGAGILAGAIVAILVGLPALRIRGLYLAVTTLAFAAAMSAFFLNPAYRVGELFAPHRDKTIEVPILWGRVALTDEFGIPHRGFYFLTLGFLGLTLLAVRAYRRNRAGRVVIGLRENTRAASSYAINPARTKLAAFAISGAIAAAAGVLLAYQQGKVDAGTYGMAPSIFIFLIAVIGGLSSPMGAVMGAVLIQGLSRFGSDLVNNLELLVTGPGLLLVLMFIPGGFAQVVYDVRDKYLRWVAGRRELIVPSLLADRRADAAMQEGVVEHAEEAQGAREAELVGTGSAEDEG